MEGGLQVPLSRSRTVHDISSEQLLPLSSMTLWEDNDGELPFILPVASTPPAEQRIQVCGLID